MLTKCIQHISLFNIYIIILPINQCCLVTSESVRVLQFKISALVLRLQTLGYQGLRVNLHRQVNGLVPELTELCCVNLYSIRNPLLTPCDVHVLLIGSTS